MYSLFHIFHLLYCHLLLSLDVLTLEHLCVCAFADLVKDLVLVASFFAH